MMDKEVRGTFFLEGEIRVGEVEDDETDDEEIGDEEENSEFVWARMGDLIISIFWGCDEALLCFVLLSSRNSSSLRFCSLRDHPLFSL